MKRLDREFCFGVILGMLLLAAAYVLLHLAPGAY